MIGSDTPLPFCFDCNKVIKNVEDAIFHGQHKIGHKSFNEIYKDAMHDAGMNRPDRKKKK